MKLNKLIFASAFLASAFTLNAQSVRISGYVDFTSTGAAQTITQSSSDSDWTVGDVVAEFGPFQNGIHFLNVDANVANVDFHTGMWLGSGIGAWYGGIGMYPDRTGDSIENGVLLQGYVVTHHFNDQLRFYSGNFAGNGWNNGYVYGSYVSAQSHVSSLAMRGTDGNDSAFTGVEVSPFAIPGFRMIAGLPVAPLNDSYEKFNSWTHLFKAVKTMVQYKWLRPNITINAGVRPNTYGTSGTREDYTESLYGESFLQLDLPTTVPYFPMNLSYDFRWRNVSEDGDNLASGKDWSTTAFAHMAMWSTRVATLVPGWTFCAEDLFGWYDTHYIAINEKAFYNRFGVSATHPITGTPYEFGAQSYFMYGQDANGSMIDRSDVYCSDLIGYSWNFMGDPVSPGSGKAGRYMGVYAYPYIQKNFQNGKASIGVELQYNRCEATNTTQCFSWRIPVGFAFWW